ncbi:MAG: twin-arginine translocase TatA/TatE family subunit [Alphaproteobacteria bacterium]|nr:twin-arginine translocase TatA/TatE family subunit [Alphaproteobacteria bacterium]
MIDIAWSEFIFISLLALILIGPKELPIVLRNVGRWVGKIRSFVKDFSEQLDLYAHNEENPSGKDSPAPSPLKPVRKKIKTSFEE